MALAKQKLDLGTDKDVLIELPEADIIPFRSRKFSAPRLKKVRRDKVSLDDLLHNQKVLEEQNLMLRQEIATLHGFFKTTLTHVELFTEEHNRYAKFVQNQMADIKNALDTIITYVGLKNWEERKTSMLRWVGVLRNFAKQQAIEFNVRDMIPDSVLSQIIKDDEVSKKKIKNRPNHRLKTRKY